MQVIISPFFLMFCAASGLGSYLAHRIWVRSVTPRLGDRLLALVAALLSIALSATSYLMRTGVYSPPRIDPGAAWLVSGLTGIGIALVCLKCVWSDQETTE